MKAQISSFSFPGRALVRVTAVFALGLALSVSAQASLVSGWTVSAGGGTLNNVSAGTVTYGDTSAQCAIYSTLNGGTGYTLGIGDSISFTGTAQNTTGSAWGQNIFRQALMYTTNPAVNTGWSGYFIGDSAPASASDFVAPFERGATGNWYSGTGATMLTGTTQATGSGVNYSTTSLPQGTYSFSYSITRTDATTLSFSWSLVETLNAAGTPVSGVYSFVGTSTDTSASTFTFNQVGIMAYQTGYAGTMTFGNLDVTYTAVPEPASVAMMAAGIMGLLWIQKRRKS